MRIIIVDDDQIVCRSLQQIITADESIEVVGIGNSYADAISLYGSCRPDIALLDIRLGDKTGIMAGKKIISEFPDAKLLFLTTFIDTMYISESFEIGAKGYILKQDFESIIPAIKAVFAGQTVFGNEVMNQLPKAFSRNKEIFQQYELAEREVEILELVAKGNNNKEISSILFLSEGTVRNYISNLLEKLQLRDRTQLAIFYYNTAAFRDPM